MKKCVVYKMNLDNLLMKVFNDDCEIINFEDITILNAYIQTEQIDLICWSAKQFNNNHIKKINVLLKNRDFTDIANILFAKDKTLEKTCLQMEVDDFLLLDDDLEIIRTRILNAIHRKERQRLAREKMWLASAFQNKLIENALFVYEIDSRNGKTTLLRESREAKTDFFPLKYYSGNFQVKEFIHPNDLEKVLHTFSYDKLQEAFWQGEKKVSLEYRIRDKKDYWIWIENEIFFVVDEYNQMRSYAYIYIIDADENEKRIYEDIIRDEVDFMMSIDIKKDLCKTIFVRKTKSGEYPITCSYSDNYSNFFARHIPDEDRKKLLPLFKLETLIENLNTQPRLNYNFPFFDKKGELLRKETSIFYTNNKKEYLIMIRRDITESYRESLRKEKLLSDALEKANRSANAKSDFLFRMSHDIRTPMNVIVGLTSLARDEINNPEVITDYLNKIDTSNQFLIGLVNNVLDMARIENHALTLYTELYTFKEFKEQIDFLIAPQCQKKNITFSFNTKNGIAKNIIVDKLRFKQIFLNLLNNAVKFTGKNGQIDFIIDFIKYTQETVQQRFIVKDNGIGMSDEFQKRMFQPFTQESSIHNNENTGTGLGLAIVKNLVELMGGTLSVESQLGKGSTFTIDLTLKLGDDLLSPETTEDKEIWHTSLSGKKVLLCEDHPLNTQITKKLLEREGLIVICTSNGREGLERFRLSPINDFDAILMDIRMPVMDGLEAARTIRKLKREDAKNIPIIAMTANAFDVDREESLVAGMNAHLAKPIKPQKMIQTLKEYIYGDC